MTIDNKIYIKKIGTFQDKKVEYLDPVADSISVITTYCWNCQCDTQDGAIIQIGDTTKYSCSVCREPKGVIAC